MATPVEILTDHEVAAGAGMGATRVATGQDAVAAVDPTAVRWRVARLVAGHRHALGLLVAGAALALLSWNLSHPALWLDESASVLATQRSWSDLWLLLHGSDAPLVAYYAVLKLLTTATTHALPPVAGHLELLYRWPSVLAAVIGAWALTVWAARYSRPGVALGAGAFLLATVGFSRYGQEARPYAFVLMAAVLSIALWSRLIEVRRRRAVLLYGLGYAVAVVVLIAGNTLAGTLVAAQLVAALVAAEPGRRAVALLRTASAAVLGGLLVAPLALNAVANGSGASNSPTITVHTLFAIFIGLFTSGPKPPFWVGPLLPFALLGLVQVASPGFRFVARVAACWALVPVALLVPAVIVKPNLLIGRYALFVLPGWAVLGGLGLVTLHQLAWWATRRRVPSVLLAAAVLVVFAGALHNQVQWLTLLRSAGGHSENIKPSLALADQPRFAGLPIFMSSTPGSVELSAYDRQDESRLIGVYAQRDGTVIWPAREAPGLTKARLRAFNRVLLMTRASKQRGCDSAAMGRDRNAVEHCIPTVLLQMQFRVLGYRDGGRGWTLAVLTRPAPSALKAPPTRTPAAGVPSP